MSTNTTVKVTIIGDSRSAQRAMSAAGKSSDGLVSKLAGFGGAVTKGLAGGAIAVGAMGVAAGKMGLETAAGNEQAKIAFTTMLGSAQKADAFLKKMVKFAAETPFDMPGLQEAASSLVSAGIAADDVIPIMSTLGDVTSGMGTGSEGIKRATVALQQMNAAQKISAEDLNQLRDAGIPVYDLLSKATGKSKKAIVELAQKGKLGKKELEQMMDALKSGKGLERFAGLMEKQSHSLTGLWSTFKDTLGQGLAKAIEPLIPLIKDGLGKASEYLAKVLPKVATGLKNTVLWVKNFVKEYQSGTGQGGKFREVVEKIGTTLKTMWGVGKSVTSWMVEHKTTVAAAATAIGALVAITKIHAAVLKVQAAGGLLKFIQGTKLITTLTKTWTAVQWLMNAALDANPIGIVVVAIAALAAGLIYAYQHSETFRSVCDTAFKGIAAAGKWMWEHMLRPAFQAFLTIISAILRGWGMLFTALSKVPGFGWAKTAADKINGAADAADRLSHSLDDVPKNVPVNVSVRYQYVNAPGKTNLIPGTTGAVLAAPHHATGTSNFAGGLTWVGENGPELVHLPGGTSIHTASESQRIDLAADKANAAAQAKINAAKKKIADAKAKADAKKRADAAAKARKAAEKKAKAAELAARKKEWARLIHGHIDPKTGKVINKYGDAVGLPSAQRLKELKAAARKVGGHFNAFGDVIDKHGKKVTVKSKRAIDHAREIGAKAKAKAKGKSKAKRSSSTRSSRSSGGSGGSGGGGGGDVYVDVAVTVQGHVMTDRQLATTLTPAIRNELIKIGKRNGNRVFPPPLT